MSVHQPKILFPVQFSLFMSVTASSRRSRWGAAQETARKKKKNLKARWEENLQMKTLCIIYATLRYTTFICSVMICRFVNHMLTDKRDASDRLENIYFLAQSDDVNQNDSSETAEKKTQTIVFWLTQRFLALPTTHALYCVLIELVHHFQFALFYEKSLHSKYMHGR